MKILKTIQALTILAVLTLAAVPAQASGTPGSSAGSSNVRAQVEPTYTVVIPTSMTEEQSLKAGVNAIGEVKATVLLLEQGTQLTCTLQGDTLKRMNGRPGDVIPYNAYYNDTLSVKTTSLALNQSVPVTVAVEQGDLDSARRGKYTGSLNFVIEIKSIP